MRIVILGLSVTSSWGNGHASTYRSLMRALDQRGHEVLFLERDVPWYAENRDLLHPPYGRTELYSSMEELKDRFTLEIARADLAIAGSYVPEGVAVGEWMLRASRGVTAFYDIDTPVTLAKLAKGDYEYITPALAGRYDLYLSFTGGPTLDCIRRLYDAPNPRALYCSVDPSLYYPEPHEQHWDLGYLGTYSDDRQPALERLLVGPAARAPHRRFVVAGPQYPDAIRWPDNVQRIEHLSPAEHRCFYNSQRFTLNITRREMVRAGWSPSVRLFEAAACGVPIVSDDWPGLEQFFQPERDILVGETERAFRMNDDERRAMAERARSNVLLNHTASNRADMAGHRLSGRMPGVHLSREGVEQAERLAQRLQTERIAAIYSSPLERATETALPLKQPYRISEAVTELDFGEWTGRRIDDLESDPTWKRFNTLRSSTRIPGGETMLEAQMRIVNEMERLRDKHPEETVAIVSHGDLIRGAILHYLGMGLDLFQRIEISPASVSVLELSEWGPKAAALNVT